MIYPAILYKDKLKEVAQVTLRNLERYKYANTSGYICFASFDCADSDEWSHIRRVSIGNNDNILGYFSAGVDRVTNSISSLYFVNFNLDVISITFVRDMQCFLEYLMERFRKISFTVIVGNPAERLYDRVIEKYHGRVVGIELQECVLNDGKYYDLKKYEILTNKGV